MKPPIQYTKSGDIDIAYQVFGSGPVDLVYIPGWISNIDWMWACPELVHFFEVLGKIARVILFDKRGTGLSDRVVNLSTLEERMADITAVMDAIACEKAILFGHSEGGSVSALFSATYPNRVVALIAFGIFAKRIYSENYPWAPTQEERQDVYDMIENSWGSGDMNLETLAPSKANNKTFMDWLANYFRSGASPKAALELTKMNTQVDIIDILKYIKTPTLLMQRTNDIDVKIEEGRFISNHIKNSKFVEFDGNDHLFWAGNTKEVLDEMTRFIKTLVPLQKLEKGLITLVLVDISSNVKSNIKKSIIHDFTNNSAASIIYQEKNFFVAAFKTSSKALKSSVDLGHNLNNSNIGFTAGIYIKEAFDSTSCKLNDRDWYIIKTMRTQTKQNQIFVNQSIKYLLSGSEYSFKHECAALEYNSCELTKLFSVTDSRITNELSNSSMPHNLSKYNSFLEDILKVIDDHIDDTTFSVDILAQKIGIGERQLQRKLKETIDKSPTQLITSIRLNKAKSALLSYSANIAEISFQYGFSSPSYFTKCFKKEFGVSPSELLQKK